MEGNRPAVGLDSGFQTRLQFQFTWNISKSPQFRSHLRQVNHNLWKVGHRASIVFDVPQVIPM